MISGRSVSDTLVAVRQAYAEAFQGGAQVARAIFTRQRARNFLLGCELAITTPVFVVSWIICAIGFAALAGFFVAKMDDADKAKRLDKLFGAKKR